MGKVGIKGMGIEGTRESTEQWNEVKKERREQGNQGGRGKEQEHWRKRQE